MYCQQKFIKKYIKVDILSILVYNLTEGTVIVMTIGDRIKKRREELQMSQEELAHLIGYKSKTSINKIELGVQNLKQSKIKEIANALQTTPSYIMGWNDETSEQVETKEQCNELFEKVYGKEVHSLIEKILSLDAIDRMVINSTVDTLLNAEKYTAKKDSSAKRIM